MQWWGVRRPPTCTSDGAQTTTTARQLDRPVQLLADVVHVLLATLPHLADIDGVGVAALALVSIGQLLLRCLQVRPEAVDVVQPGRRPDTLRVGRQERHGILVQRVELPHHRDHGRHVGVVLSSLLEPIDLLVQIDVALVVGLDSLPPEVCERHHEGYPHHHHNGGVVGEELVDGGHSSPFLRCASAAPRSK